MTGVPVPRLRDLVAEALYPTSALELASICDGFEMPPADADKQPMSSKRGYVRNRLGKMSREALQAVARRVAVDYPQSVLAQELAASGDVDAAPRNIIFATLAKPDLVVTDALFNELEHVGEETALIFNEVIPDEGLTVRALKAWWQARSVGASLYLRMEQSLTIGGSSDAERTLLKVYYKEVVAGAGDDAPALLPQVWLHYDPRTARSRAQKAVPRQRVDFLMVMKARRRVVLEVDGRHHFSDTEGRASLARYSEMVAADRSLRLSGYEVYRFGANELVGSNGSATAREFFQRLLS